MIWLFSGVGPWFTLVGLKLSSSFTKVEKQYPFRDAQKSDLFLGQPHVMLCLHVRCWVVVGLNHPQIILSLSKSFSVSGKSMKELGLPELGNEKQEEEEGEGEDNVKGEDEQEKTLEEDVDEEMKGEKRGE